MQENISIFLNTVYFSIITPICVMYIVDRWLFDLLHYYIIPMYRMCYYGEPNVLRLKGKCIYIAHFL